MAKKRYTVSLSANYTEVVIDIDEDFVIDPIKQYTTKNAIKDMVEFWSDWETDLEYQDGDYIKLFLKNLARQCFMLGFSTTLNEKGIAQEIESQEGWCLLDGSKGIWIVNIDDCRFDNDDMEVAEIEIAETEE